MLSVRFVFCYIDIVSKNDMYVMNMICIVIDIKFDLMYDFIKFCIKLFVICYCFCDSIILS